MTSLLDYIGEFIKAHNSYFDSFKVNGVQLPDGQVIEFTDGKEKQFIGISDNLGTSGYIRFDPQITYSSERRITSSASIGGFIKQCRLVAFSWKPEITSQQLMTKLVMDLKKIPFSTSRQKPIITIRRSNHNYLDVVKEELKRETVGGYGFTCISIDFELKYFEGECEMCDPFNPDDGYVLIVDQDGNVIARKSLGEIYEVISFSGIRDNGPPYTNSIIDNS